MFKALDIRDQTEIIILDPKWRQAIPQLREWDHHDYLKCQGCKQPVRVCAGAPGKSRPHFAHKHLSNCDYEDASPVLRAARAVLYEWLVSQFGENVTIEKQVEGLDLFRPMDCWVTRDSAVYAYWIFDSRLKPEKRKALKEGLIKLGVHCSWVFAVDMLHPAPGHPDQLILSTTEREFIQRSRYDIPRAGHHSAGGSLHYLDAEKHKLITFRGLSVCHPPQIHEGSCQTSDLTRIMLSPQSGEFAHEGETDRLQEYDQLQQEIKKSPRKRWELHALQKRPDLEIQPSEHEDRGEGHRIQEREAANQEPDRQNELTTAYPFQQEKSGRCIFCGKLTTHWWWYDGKTGQCKCQSCKKEGKT